MFGGDYDERMGARRERTGYRVSVAGGRCVRKGPAANTCRITTQHNMLGAVEVFARSESQACGEKSKSNGTQSQELVLVECDWLAKVELFMVAGMFYAMPNFEYRFNVYADRSQSLNQFSEY